MNRNVAGLLQTVFAVLTFPITVFAALLMVVQEWIERVDDRLKFP